MKILRRTDLLGRNSPWFRVQITLREAWLRVYPQCAGPRKIPALVRPRLRHNWPHEKGKKYRSDPGFSFT